MTHRRFASFSIIALEKLFDEKRLVLPELEAISAELAFRTTTRSTKLKERVLQAIAVFGSIAPPEDDPPWSGYERSLNDAERSLILNAPVIALAKNLNALPLLNQGTHLARASEHTMVPHFRKEIEERGLDFKLSSDAFGLATRLAIFELGNGPVQRWPSFALLFRKMLGQKSVPWLPMLFLAAVSSPDLVSIDIDLAEIIAFRDDHRS